MYIFDAHTKSFKTVLSVKAPQYNKAKLACKTIVKPVGYQRAIASGTNTRIRLATGKQRTPKATHTCQMCHPIALEHCSEFITTLLALNLNINPIPVTKLHGPSAGKSVTEVIFT